MKVYATSYYALQLRKMQPKPYIKTKTDLKEQIQEKKDYDTYIKNFETERTNLMLLLQNNEEKIKEVMNIEYIQEKDTLFIKDTTKEEEQLARELFNLCIGIQTIVINNTSFSRNVLAKEE